MSRGKSRDKHATKIEVPGEFLVQLNELPTGKWLTQVYQIIDRIRVIFVSNDYGKRVATGWAVRALLDQEAVCSQHSDLFDQLAKTYVNFKRVLQGLETPLYHGMWESRTLCGKGRELTLSYQQQLRGDQIPH